MAATKIDIKKALNPDWLKSNKYTVILPKNKIHRIRLVQILWNNTNRETPKERWTLLMQVIDGISLRTFHTLRKHNFKYNTATIGKKYFEDKNMLQQFGTDSFLVDVRDNVTELIKYNFNVEFKKADEVKIEPPPVLIDPEKVEKIRESQVTVKTVAEIKDENDREKLGIRICEEMATGNVDISIACNKYGVSTADFIHWLTQSETLTIAYEQAMNYATFTQKSSQAISLNLRIKELLQRKHVRTETVNYKKVFNQWNPSGVWVETSKTITKRDLDERGLAMLENLVRNVPLPENMNDEFAGMPEAEQQAYVLELMAKRDNLKKNRNK